jgi:hypothetical protein
MGNAVTVQAPPAPTVAETFMGLVDVAAIATPASIEPAAITASLKGLFIVFLLVVILSFYR